MKKASIVLFLIILLLVCFSACKSTPDASESNDVQEDESTDGDSSPARDGEDISYRSDGSLEKIIKYKSGAIVWIREYSEIGDCTRYTEYTAYGHFVEDKIGGALTERITFYDTEGVVSESIVYEYHENAMTRRETYYSGGGQIKGVCEYDESGVLIKTHIYDRDGENYKLTEIVDFVYDAEGKPLKDSYFSADGSLVSECEYNENGDTVLVLRYGENGELASYTVYEYSESGVRLRYITYRSYEVISSVCEYREDGTKWTLTNYFENGNVSLFYRYNEAEIIEKIEKYDENGEIASYEEFDEVGRRTKYVTFNPDKTILVYDGSYNIVEGTRYLRQANGTLIKYEYLEGKIRSEAFYGDGSNILYLTTYDANGNKTGDVRYGKGESVESRTIYRYDELGALLSYTVYEANGTTLTYGSEGNIISGVRYVYVKGALYQKLEYAGGVRSKETLYSGKNVVMISEFDENDTMRKESFYTSGKISKIREYDANGVLRKVTLYNSRGRVTSVTKYDEKGNKI